MTKICTAAALAALTFVASAGPAAAVTVSLSGTILNSCALTVGSSGTLAPASDGTRLGSEESGGSAASLTVVATGSAPTLTFAAPTLNAPAGSSGSTVAIRYNAGGSGASSGYTSSQTTASSNLIDGFTVHARVTNASGFVNGTYTASTVVTCGQ